MASAHPQIAGLSDWRPLARGGFAAVWQARQDSLGRQVAVKVDFRPLDDDKQRRRFLREAGAAGRLSGHPGIVTVHDAGILPDDRPYLVLELCPGGSLSAWLAPEKRPSIERVRDVGVRIADALAAAHARRVIHRDVKPANILVDAYGNVGLTDFGLAAIPEPGAELSVTIEALTPAYAPPEVFGAQPATEAGDVYALAATLYALLAGHPPRWPTDGHTPSLPEMLQLHAAPVPRLPQVPPSLLDAIGASLTADAAERPTAAEFRDRLAGVDLGPDATVDRRVLALTGGGTGPTATDGQAADGQAADGPGGPIAPAADLLVPERSAERQRGRRNQAVFVGVLALIIAALVAGIIYLSLTEGRGPFAVPAPGNASASSVPQTPGPTPASATLSLSPSPSPSDSPDSPAASIPAGFAGCDRFGAGALCPTVPECWGSIQSLRDLLAVATPVDCSETHTYQTYAGVQLARQPRTQSDLEDDTVIRELCTPAVLDDRLASGRMRVEWEIQVIPYKVFPTTDSVSRCLVNTGRQRSSPLELVEP